MPVVDPAPPSAVAEPSRRLPANSDTGPAYAVLVPLSVSALVELFCTTPSSAAPSGALSSAPAAPVPVLLRVPVWLMVPVLIVIPFAKVPLCDTTTLPVPVVPLVTLNSLAFDVLTSVFPPAPTTMGCVVTESGDVLLSNAISLTFAADPTTDRRRSRIGTLIREAPREIHRVGREGDRRRGACTDHAHITRSRDAAADDQ